MEVEADLRSKYAELTQYVPDGVTTTSVEMPDGTMPCWAELPNGTRRCWIQMPDGTKDHWIDIPDGKKRDLIEILDGKFPRVVERGRMRANDHPYVSAVLFPHACQQYDAAPVGTGADRQRDFDSFVRSAKDKTGTKKFQEWAGGERVTLAIVFTDVVGSTALGEKIRDEAMNEVRRAHFAQSRKLIDHFKGREIKTLGDSFMAAFKSADAALDYAIALQRSTGHPQVQIRAGIHIGQMEVEEGDVSGGTVNFAARVKEAIVSAEIWLSERAKEDIDRLGAAQHKRLGWEPHTNIAMKGFPGGFTLWSVEDVPGG